MIYYGADGYMTDINDKACETFGIGSREALMKRRVKIWAADRPLSSKSFVNTKVEPQMATTRKATA